MFTTFGIMISIHIDTAVGQEWKELLLLLLGAFIGSYGKIIDCTDTCGKVFDYAGTTSA